LFDLKKPIWLIETQPIDAKAHPTNLEITTGADDPKVCAEASHSVAQQTQRKKQREISVRRGQETMGRLSHTPGAKRRGTRELGGSGRHGAGQSKKPCATGITLPHTQPQSARIVKGRAESSPPLRPKETRRTAIETKRQKSKLEGNDPKNRPTSAHSQTKSLRSESKANQTDSGWGFSNSAGRGGEGRGKIRLIILFSVSIFLSRHAPISGNLGLLNWESAPEGGRGTPTQLSSSPVLAKSSVFQAMS